MISMEPLAENCIRRKDQDPVRLQEDGVERITDISIPRDRGSSFDLMKLIKTVLAVIVLLI
jgi:hypothetical protein